MTTPHTRGTTARTAGLHLFTAAARHTPERPERRPAPVPGSARPAPAAVRKEPSV